jgi:hypothetical protein
MWLQTVRDFGASDRRRSSSKELRAGQAPASSGEHSGRRTVTNPHDVAYEHAELLDGYGHDSIATVATG